MNFTLKKTSTLAQNKKPLIAFVLGVVVAMPITQSLGFDGGLSHYTLLGLFFAVSFMLYLICRAVSVFMEATFDPKMTYSDFFAVKHIDLPAIPNEKELYAYMNKADKMHMKGATRLHDSVLNQYNVDRFGNVR